MEGIRRFSLSSFPGTAMPAPFLLILVILLWSGCASSEPKKASPQALRSHALNEVGYKNYQEGDLQAAMVYFKKALALAESAAVRDEEVRARISMGQILDEQDRFDEAQEHFTKALRIARDLEEEPILFNALEAMGKHAFRIEQFDEAESLLLEAMEIAEDLDSLEMQAMTLNDLGTVYTETGRTEEGVAALLEALFLYDNLEGRISVQGQGSVSNNLAVIRQEQGRFMDAWDLLTTSLSCYDQLGDSEALITCHANMADLLETWGKKSDALIQYEVAFGIAKGIPNRRWMEIALENTIRLTKELDMHFLRGEYTKELEALRLEIHGRTNPP